MGSLSSTMTSLQEPDHQIRNLRSKNITRCRSSGHSGLYLGFRGEITRRFKLGTFHLSLADLTTLTNEGWLQDLFNKCTRCQTFLSRAYFVRSALHLFNNACSFQTLCKANLIKSIVSCAIIQLIKRMSFGKWRCERGKNVGGSWVANK